MSANAPAPNVAAAPPPAPLQPLPYQAAMVEYLKEQEPELWKWFSSNRVQQEHTDAVRLELLKSTYRLDRAAHGRLYDAADHVARRLGLSAPTTFYQAHHAVELNLGIVYVPGEAHITLRGPVLRSLEDAELMAALGHELGHLTLWENWDRDYLVAEQVLSAMVTDVEAGPAHHQSGRLYALFTEIYCDRAAVQATADPAATIAMLVKIQTGLTEVSAEGYRRQAAEIFEKAVPTVDGLTHPASYIRTRAIDVWTGAAPDADAQIERILRGPLSLEHVDLLGQRTLAELTRALLDAFLAPTWCRTDAVLAHARSYFSDFAAPPARAVPPALASQIAGGDASLQDYCCYVLLDFALADPDLEDAPIAAALLLGRQLGLTARLESILAKETKLRKKQIEALQRDAETIVAKASVPVADP